MMLHWASAFALVLATMSTTLVAAMAQSHADLSGRLSQPSEPFGLEAEPVGDGDLVTKWRQVVVEINAERDVLAHCGAEENRCPSAARKFREIVAKVRDVTGRARIGIINRAINLAVRPVSDEARWGVPDRWSAPLATLESGLGDCEDYAIAKYLALRTTGIADDDVYLVIVRDLAVQETHALVTVRLDDTWVTLDNRRLTLVADVDLRRTLPLFIIGQDGVRRFPPAITVEASAAPFQPAPATPSALGFSRPIVSGQSRVPRDFRQLGLWENVRREDRYRQIRRTVKLR